jgi:hypothetical protein
MPSRNQSGTTTGPFVVMLLGAAILAAGVVRFVLLGHFSLRLAVYCLLSIPVAVLLLMVFDYTLHHARIACLLVVVILLVLAIPSPSFCVGLGLALIGMVATKWP